MVREKEQISDIVISTKVALKTKTEIKYLLYGGCFYEWRSSTNT